MSRVYVFIDEAGDFTFERKPGASHYFVIGSTTMADCSVGQELLDLRRELLWEGTVLEQFHASADKQHVRDRVFPVIARSDVRIDATLLKKPKAQPHLRENPARMYKQALFTHLRYLVPRVAGRGDDLTVIVSAVQVKKMNHALNDAVTDVVSQVARTRRRITAFHHASSDPCLQVPGYATWTIQRKWEGNDPRWYDQVKHLIGWEFDAFEPGQTTYY